MPPQLGTSLAQLRRQNFLRRHLQISLLKGLAIALPHYVFHEPGRFGAGEASAGAKTPRKFLAEVHVFIFYVYYMFTVYNHCQ